jgi:hypothetical protein
MKTLAHPLPIARPVRRRVVIKNSFDPVETSRVIGKGITLWVLFTSALNWLHYKKINDKRNEDR